jgi:hypothetical protein
MRLANLSLCVSFFSAALQGQTTSSREDLLLLTDRLGAAMAGDDWKTAATISSTLKDGVREARNLALSSDNREQVDRVLSWLPKDTETLVVAQQPFTLPTQRQEKVDATMTVRGYVLIPLDAFAQGGLLKSVDGATMRYAVLAARKFTDHPADDKGVLALGLIAFEGCAVYGFADPIPDSAFSQVPDASFLGQPVWSMKQEGEWLDQDGTPGYETYWAAKIKPDVLLACSNRDFFASVVTEASSAAMKTSARFAYLPEWKQIDRSAPVWGLRDFTLANPETDPSHPARGMAGAMDASAVGVVFQAGRPEGKVQTRWLSKAKENPFDHFDEVAELKGAVTTRQVSEGVWEMTINDEREAGSYAVLATLAMLGFAVYL